MLKKVDLGEAATVEDVSNKYAQETSSLNIEVIAQESRNRINQAIKNKDLPSLLANYDNKGMMAFAASHLKGCNRNHFENWLVRVLNNKSVPGLIETIQEILPDIGPQ